MTLACQDRVISPRLEDFFLKYRQETDYITTASCKITHKSRYMAYGFFYILNVEWQQERRMFGIGVVQPWPTITMSTVLNYLCFQSFHYILFSVCMCVFTHTHACTYHSTHVEVKGQLMEVSSFFLPCGS